MSITAASVCEASTTADDTRKRKTRDASVVSGGLLAAKALKNEGVGTILTLCGGHIIDIHGGCVDQGIRVGPREYAPGTKTQTMRK